MAYVEERDYKGKGTIEIVEGAQSITVHSKYEYNPFGIVDYVVDEWPLLYISSFETKKGEL